MAPTVIDKAYRAPMRPRDRDAGQFDGARFGVENGLVGIGGVISPAPASVDEAVLNALDQINQKTSRMISRFASLPDGSLIWTQIDEDSYCLGRLTGQWRYDSSGDAGQAGIVHLRPVEWIPEKIPIEKVPPAVLDSFARGGKNFQQIRASEAGPSSRQLWADHQPTAD
ncbi:MAG: hypothetical protein WBP55_04050 [Solirubrobacterales bacterium]